MNKINAAFGIGGPKLMVRTVEQNTGLTINDYIEVNFPGFVKVVNALGGVNICLPFAVDDPYSGLHMAAGRHHVHGVTALEFVRDRHSFALSDLARISDQQQLLSSMLREAISSGTLADPVKLSGFLTAVTGAIRVDQRLNVTSLADRLRGISPSQVTFMTVPLANTNYITSTGESAVLWDSQAAGQLFAELKADDLPVKQQHPRTAKKQQKQQTAARAETEPGIGRRLQRDPDHRAVREYRRAAYPARLHRAWRRAVLDEQRRRPDGNRVPAGNDHLSAGCAQGAARCQHPPGERPGQGQHRARHERASGHRRSTEHPGGRDQPGPMGRRPRHRTRAGSSRAAARRLAAFRPAARRAQADG